MNVAVQGPALTTAEVRERVMDAAERGAPVRVVAGGTWLDAGRPVRAVSRLAVAELRGVVDYVPGDLTLTVRGGTTLEEIRALTATHDQWLALDPFGGAGATLGATLATSSSGPLAHAFGGPRDHVLGLEVVTGRADVVRAGGRVVKNVAGFDLTRLFTGSWGTLGVITEATVRLRALPERMETVAIALAADDATLRRQLDAIRGASLAPLALECLSERMAIRLGLGAGARLLARLAGNSALIASQRDVLARIAPLDPVPDGTWETLRTVEPQSAVVIRFSRSPSRFPSSWATAMRAAGLSSGGLAHGTPARGIARAIVSLESEEQLAALLDVVRSFDGTAIAERLPPAAWSGAAFRNPVADRLSRGIKERFDPLRVLNPGILGVGT